ncbi:glycosyltransferase [Xenorhabdus ehlersii]|uniref:Glycosyltransferase n=1 Tax=Xenorhabdus ehlersii TaxID=290111 RepID=A0A2D0IK26_9GAMM|nr:glycosyltransferase [Xenorhabdus ehlersii]PHM22111.1 glycosyltransferase [Xenorhabdus ehlersii]RKE93328.1 glycosyltransferase involved in cell wall biosynthesis [Xenorhabdus ehlersii]
MKISVLVLNACDLGGIERSSFTLVKTLKRAGHTVELVSVYENDEVALNRSESYRLLNGKNELLKIKNYIKGLDDSTIIISTYDRLSFLISFVSFLLRKKNKLIAHQHADYFAHNSRVRFLRKIGYRIGCKAIVCLTQKDYKYYSQWHSNCFVIPNILDLEASQFDDNGIDFSSRNTDFMAAGRLNPIKRYEDFIKLYDALMKKYNLKFKLFGHGEDDERLLRLSLSSKDILQGSTKNMLDEMKDAKFFIVTSYRESFSMVIVEAMAAGCVVISYDCPTGPGEIITDGVDGFLISNGDFSSLVQKCLWLLENNVNLDTMRHNARISAQKYYPENVVKKWNDLFQNI